MFYGKIPMFAANKRYFRSINLHTKKYTQAHTCDRYKSSIYVDPNLTCLKKKCCCYHYYWLGRLEADLKQYCTIFTLGYLHRIILLYILFKKLVLFIHIRDSCAINKRRNYVGTYIYRQYCIKECRISQMSQIFKNTEQKSILKWS